MSLWFCFNLNSSENVKMKVEPTFAFVILLKAECGPHVADLYNFVKHRIPIFVLPLLAVNFTYVTYPLLASVSLFINWDNNNVYIIDLLMVFNEIVHLVYSNQQSILG